MLGAFYCDSVHKSVKSGRAICLNLNMGDIMNMLVCTMAERVHKRRDAARGQQVRVCFA